MATKSGFVEITFDVGVISCYIIKVYTVEIVLKQVYSLSSRCTFWQIKAGNTLRKNLDRN